MLFLNAVVLNASHLDIIDINVSEFSPFVSNSFNLGENYYGAHREGPSAEVETAARTHDGLDEFQKRKIHGRRARHVLRDSGKRER